MTTNMCCFYRLPVAEICPWDKSWSQYMSCYSLLVRLGKYQYFVKIHGDDLNAWGGFTNNTRSLGWFCKSRGCEITLLYGYTTSNVDRYGGMRVWWSSTSTSGYRLTRTWWAMISMVWWWCGPCASYPSTNNLQTCEMHAYRRSEFIYTTITFWM